MKHRFLYIQGGIFVVNRYQKGSLSLTGVTVAELLLNEREMCASILIYTSWCFVVQSSDTIVRWCEVSNVVRRHWDIGTMLVALLVACAIGVVLITPLHHWNIAPLGTCPMRYWTIVPLGNYAGGGFMTTKHFLNCIVFICISFIIARTHWRDMTVNCKQRLIKSFVCTTFTKYLNIIFY